MNPARKTDNMPLEITRRLEFCAGHRLMNHGGKCEHLHGHNYQVELTLCGEQTDSVGRLVDFAIVKQVFKQWIDSHWDHGMILCEKDTDFIAAVRKLGSKLYLMPNNPTAENMAEHLLRGIGPELMRRIAELADDDDGTVNIALSRVTVWETPQSSATAWANR